MESKKINCWDLPCESRGLQVCCCCCEYQPTCKERCADGMCEFWHDEEGNKWTKDWNKNRVKDLIERLTSK